MADDLHPYPDADDPIRCPQCGHACGNTIDRNQGVTLACQYCGFGKPPEPTWRRNLRSALLVAKTRGLKTVPVYSADLETVLKETAPSYEKT